MSLNIPLFIKKLILVTIVFILSLVPALLYSQISITIDDASGRLGEKLVPLDIKITNLSDTIAGYNIWLQLNRPDLVKFQQGNVQKHDTTFWKCNQYSGADCIDSSKVFTLTGWDFYHVDSSIEFQYLYEKSNYIMPNWLTLTRSIGGFGLDLNLFSGNLTGEEPYIYPSPDEELLIRLYLEVVDSLNPITTDSLVTIHLEYPYNYFSFSKPSGESLVWTPEEYTYKACYLCLQWVDTLCLFWVESNCVAPYDSIGVVIDTFSVFDSTYFEFNDGSFTLLPACGFSLATADYDISNLVALVDFIFIGGPTLTNAEADYTCDCAVDISDLVGFVDFIFQGGEAPSCTTE